MRKLKLQEAQGLDQLIESGSAGFFPLFFNDWIHESFADINEIRPITFSKAAENVHNVYRKIEKYHSLERKKTAIHALENHERRAFVLSFMKMVEYRTLDKLRELH